MILKQRSILLDLVRNDKLILDMRDIFGGGKSPKKQTSKYIQAFENTFNNKIDEEED